MSSRGGDSVVTVVARVLGKDAGEEKEVVMWFLEIGCGYLS